ncbi:hypothetical protein, partial [Fulvivirga lutimaris]|uniref:hypothetical protein n=1 Tax=Fulvivirga lutimaris TaxID=1819566 RepID=UPI001C887B43
SIGAPFGSNSKTGDARIAGTLASLCGLEHALASESQENIEQSIQKIIMMQAYTMFIGGLPMIFYGDEVGYTNDYSYKNDPAKSNDNRWVHRPLIDWDKNLLSQDSNTLEYIIFSRTQRLIKLRKYLPAIGDYKNLVWPTSQNKHIALFRREHKGKILYGVFNFSQNKEKLTWYAFKENSVTPETLFDHWSEQEHTVRLDNEFLWLQPYQFFLFEVK